MFSVSFSGVFFFNNIFSGSALTAENLTAVVKATGNDVPAYYPTLFAAYLEKSGGCDKFCKLGGGGKNMFFVFFQTPRNAMHTNGTPITTPLPPPTPPPPTQTDITTNPVVYIYLLVRCNFNATVGGCVGHRCRVGRCDMDGC